MILLKTCPRCRGDVFEERMLGGFTDLVCAQCGWRVDKKAYLAGKKVNPREQAEPWRKWGGRPPVYRP